MSSTEEPSGRSLGPFSPSLQTAPSNPSQPGGNMPQTVIDSPEKGGTQDNAPQKKKRIKKKHTGENALKKFFPDNFLKLHKTQGVIFDVNNHHTCPFTRLYTHAFPFFISLHHLRGTHCNTSKKNRWHRCREVLGQTRSKSRGAS